MKFLLPGNWRPTSWAKWYVVQIFVFAFIYGLQAPSFYHATAHLEPSIWDDQRKMAMEYQEQLESRREELRLAEDFGEMPVSVFFRYDRENHKANIIIQDGGLGISSFTGEVHLGTQQISSANPSYRWSVSSDFFDEDQLDDKYGQGRRPPWTGLRFEPSEQFVTLFRGWEAANRGQLYRPTDAGFRLLYFSVVTTTTLGYGDIVPLTPSARFWVAIQSILGVVLVGGFLHSLLSRREN